MKTLLFWGPSDGYMSSESRPKDDFLFFSPLERLPPLLFLLLSFLYRFPSKPYIWRLGRDALQALHGTAGFLHCVSRLGGYLLHVCVVKGMAWRAF
jgi:hypothetical protein